MTNGVILWTFSNASFFSLYIKIISAAVVASLEKRGSPEKCVSPEKSVSPEKCVSPKISEKCDLPETGVFS